MCRCHVHSCCDGCSGGIDRRRFLQGTAAAVTLGGLGSLAGAADDKAGKVRVATVFLANTEIREIWPYPNFDADGRQREVLAALRQGCPEIEFVPVTVKNPDDVKKALALKTEVDGYLVYVVTLDWALAAMIVDVGLLGKPMLVANEFLGGCGGFLTRYSALCTRGIPAAAVSSRRLSDLVLVARQFADVRQKHITPTVFAQRCEQVYRTTFGERVKRETEDDPVTLTDIGKCVERFRKSSFLIVGRGEAGEQRNFLGAKARYIDFAELGELYKKVDMDHAKEWSARWHKAAEFVTGPGPGAVDKAAAVYLATLELLKKYNTDSVTMNCLGGFSSGKLPAYPCLGFIEILNDGGQGVCEAHPDDTLSMLMARILTGRPGYVSDPALDTSKNQIVYAHCVATTKPFGAGSDSNRFSILTLHNRDPRGACAQSFLPPGYMTTSFRTNAERKEMIIHQAKAVDNLVSDYGCRTKLVAEPSGDIGKLFDQWDQFGWHRVTVYGDVKEPLAEFAKALGLKVIEEA